jgi:hypothetical protein
MDISVAALPPRQPTISYADKKHRLFPLYEKYRNFCSEDLITASAFRDWLHQHNIEQVGDEAAKHPRYFEFLAWMQTEQGGARKCPAGVFPYNFYFWLEDGRW